MPPGDHAPPRDVEHLCRALDALGVHHGLAAAPDDRAATWIPFEELLGDAERHVDALARALGGPRPAVAASLVARSLLPLVVSPVAVAWARWRRMPDLGVDNLVVGVDDDRIVAVAMGGPGLVSGVGDDTTWFRDTILSGVCERAIEQLRAVAPLGTRHLWGNVALAIAGPFAGMLATGVHDGRQDRDRLLASRPGLAGLVEVVPVGEDRPVEVVRRRSCCLLTKLPEPHGAMCGTCSLHPRDAHVERLAGYYLALATDASGPR